MKIFTQEYFKKSFHGSSLKEAYLKACKWVSTNVISKAELGRNTLVKYDKKEQKGTQLPTIEVTLFAVINEAEVRERHCAICKETHASFFINENCNCAWCNTSAYQRRIDEIMARKKQFCIEKLNQEVNW